MTKMEVIGNLPEMNNFDLLIREKEFLKVDRFKSLQPGENLKRHLLLKIPKKPAEYKEAKDIHIIIDQLDFVKLIPSQYFIYFSDDSDENLKINALLKSCFNYFHVSSIGIMAVCLVLGDPVTDTFVVEIDLKMRKTKQISHIREKVTISTSERNEKLELLNRSPREINVEKELGGVFLPPEDEIYKHFDEKLSSGHIHIIVQPPITDGLGGTKLPYLPNNKPFEGISFTNPDISYRSKVVFSLVKDLIKRKIILVQATPYSGKTSLAQLMDSEAFGELWKRVIGVRWFEWIEQCQRAPTILILDKIQLLCKQECGIDESKKLSADVFWKTIKSCLREMTNIYIIMFGAYGYNSANSAGLSIPVEIPPSKCKSLLDIVFNHEELKEYVEKFCKKYFRLDTCDVSKFSEYIQATTEGHTGLVCHILRHTNETMGRQIRENVLTWKDIFAYLNSHNFNFSIDGCRASLNVQTLSIEQLEICENVYLNGTTLYKPLNTSIQYLVKSGILVVDDKALRFSAPLIMRSFFQQYYGNHHSTEITPSSLYHFIVKIFTAMCNVQSGKILRETLGFGIDGNLLEKTWQKEFYRVGMQVLGMNHFLSYDVGEVFGCDGYINFYVDGLDWAIELLRDSKHMTEHSNRFELTGKY
ncbi:43135_t:CDS:2 [Gigaspora margarita]|uniref:43135_t:CDS:1 n=1 Tax=Gigaspora margarita TaxID=4874 RepID=A0ABM8VXI7_GIGMA|nr:43135_t:CDS:2 [Gigaspora margarita]